MNLHDPILVSIVHPDSLVRSCLVSALNRACGIDVNLAVPDMCTLDELLPRHARSHVIVADYGAGVALAARALRDVHLAPVVVVSGADREWELRNAMTHHVRGYLVPGFELEHLDDGVRAVHGGRRYLCARAAARLAESLSYEGLTDREAEVLALIVGGEPNKIISRLLSISIGTVKSHIKSVYAKLGVASRSQAIAVADRRGLLRRELADDASPRLVTPRLVPQRLPQPQERFADVAFG